jgi:hypothetical protein
MHVVATIAFTAFLLSIPTGVIRFFGGELITFLTHPPGRIIVTIFFGAVFVVLIYNLRHWYLSSNRLGSQFLKLVFLSAWYSPMYFYRTQLSSPRADADL